MLCPGNENVYTVGRVMTETDALPWRSSARCAKFDELWVPTELNMEIFRKVSQNVHIIPEAIGIEYFDDMYDGFPVSRFVREMCEDQRFKFLSVFKWEVRKNWRALFSAFFRAFEKNLEVVIYVKTSKYMNADPVMDIKKLRRELKVDDVWLNSAVQVSVERLSDGDMRKLFSCADAFAMASFGEGWGRPYAEAMASGLPVIAPAWGGQTYFMNNANSILVK